MKLEIDIPSILYNDAKENRGYISVNKMEIAWKAIADGKPIEQEPRKGHWVPYLKEGLIVKCSECKSRFTLGYNFCPNCGSDNREVEE